MITDKVSEGPRVGRTGVATASRAGRVASFDAGALCLLACGALAVLLISLLLFATGASEKNETRAWIVAFALALPAGLFLAAYQERRLASAAPAAAGRALAAGLALLAVAFLLRRDGSGDRLHHAILVVAALGAVLAPFAAARLWRNPTDERHEIAGVVGLAATALIILLFVPRPALEPAQLVPALALAGLAVLALRRRRPLRWGTRARLGLDVGVCLLIALVVGQLPELLPYTGNLLIHHLYFLGPANDVIHGRAMLGTAWSQYGTGLIDLLGLFGKVAPLGFGTLALVVVVLTVAAYISVYATLRLAGLGFLLTSIAIAVAALGNVFACVESYVVFPSTSPLRFGVPYLMVLAAVLGARCPHRRGAGQLAVLVLLALAASLSFEMFAYSAGTYAALVLVEALADGGGFRPVLRRLVDGAVLGIGVSVISVSLFSLATLALSGHLSWGPYFEYLKLYSTGEFFTLPVQFFSAGPLMGAALFVSAAMLLWLAGAAPNALSPPLRAALAGFTGFGVVTFTYYLGRSHPNNLLVLLVPVVAVAALWMQVLLTADTPGWRIGATGVIALAMAMIAVAAWPSVEAKRGDTALGLMVPGGRSLATGFDGLADNPPLNPLTPVGAELLDRYWQPGEPALVVSDPDLTTEILLADERRNLLPISHAPEDDLIDSSQGRVRAAAERVPAGTLMLTSPLPGPESGWPPFEHIQLTALHVLHQRFRFELVRRDSSGFEVVRLVSRP